ncbi:MAG: carbohydrate ABC transporter permease [Anaerolineales bacterium]
MSRHTGSKIPSLYDVPQHPATRKDLTLLEILRGTRAQEIINTIMTVIVLTIGAIVIFLPIAFMFGTSLKDKTQMKMFPPPILPYAYTTVLVDGKDEPLYATTTEDGEMDLALIKKAPGGNGIFVDPKDPTKQYTLIIKNQTQLTHLAFHWGNYKEALESQPFSLYFINTCIVVFVSMFGMMVSSAMVAYGFSRFRSKVLNVLFIILLSTIMLPSQVRMIPLYVFFQNLGWVDTLLPLIVPAFFASAYDVFLLRQFFMSIPLEMDDAAKIDGANRIQSFIYVILPQSIPALFSVCILHFIWAWNDFYEPLIYLHSQTKWTIAVGLQTFNAIYTENTHLIMAASMILVLPPIILFLLSQRIFVQGVVISGVKG